MCKLSFALLDYKTTIVLRISVLDLPKKHKSALEHDDELIVLTS